MEIKLDKTVLLVAVTKAITSGEFNNEEYELDNLQLLEDILKSKQSKFIQSVTINEYEFSLVESYLEEM
jgi:hypothetical protein